jgi:3-phytase
LAVYDLTGKQVQFLPDGRMNNVDHRDGFPLGGEKVSLVTSSNRSDNSIAIYRVNPETRRLENVAARRIVTIEAYGACMYHSRKTDKFYYIVTNKQGMVEQFELFDNGKGRVDAKRVWRFKVGTQLEGCVADDELGFLYIGEEMVGIWKYGAEPDANLDRIKVDGVAPEGHLVADVEGLTIAYERDGKGYLIASSQGSNSFVVYRREGDNAYVKTFRIVAGNGIDEVTETDGIHVTLANLGPMFPNGVFIAQDGLEDRGSQNFKLVPWQLIVGEQ